LNPENITRRIDKTTFSNLKGAPLRLKSLKTIKFEFLSKFILRNQYYWYEQFLAELSKSIASLLIGGKVAK
jgi:hypothetical protein